MISYHIYCILKHIIIASVIVILGNYFLIIAITMLVSFVNSYVLRLATKRGSEQSANVERGPNREALGCLANYESETREVFWPKCNPRAVIGPQAPGFALLPLLSHCSDWLGQCQQHFSKIYCSAYDRIQFGCLPNSSIENTYYIFQITPLSLLHNI